jgi:hypothetical protein
MARAVLADDLPPNTSGYPELHHHEAITVQEAKAGIL